jgi:hypothetical protein
VDIWHASINFHEFLRLFVYYYFISTKNQQNAHRYSNKISGYPRRFIRENIWIFDIRRISDILYSNSISEQNIRIRIRYPKKVRISEKSIRTSVYHLRIRIRTDIFRTILHPYSGRLTGPAADWWDSYTAAHDAADTITWAEFSTQFRNYHIPAGLMKIKKKEFLSLKQGNMSVREYRDKFIQLSRYAPDEVAEDERKQEHFIEGLNGPLQYALVAHTFPSFQRLLDKALAIEHKRVQLGDLKRKAIS